MKRRGKILVALTTILLSAMIAVSCSGGTGDTPPPDAPLNVEIALDKTSAEIDISESITIKATTKQTLESVTFTINTNDYVTISASEDGKTLTVTGKAVGTTVITATVGSKTATCTVTVVDRGSVPTIKFINCENSFNLYNGDTFTIEAKIVFRGEEKTAAITITSSDPSVVSVNGLTITANDLGQATLTLSATYEGQSVTDYVVVTVLPSPVIDEEGGFWNDSSTGDFGGNYKW